MPDHRHHLPQLDAEVFLTDGGLETTLIFDDGIELPDFAAFPLLADPAGPRSTATSIRTPQSRFVMVSASSSRRRRGGPAPTGAHGSARTWRIWRPSTATPSPCWSSSAGAT